MHGRMLRFAALTLMSVLIISQCAAAAAAERAVRVTSIKPATNEVTLTVGQRYFFELELKPGSAAAYRDVEAVSSDSNVARVMSDNAMSDPCAVVAVGEGTAIITIKAKKGRGIAKCQITVLPLPEGSSLGVQKDADALTKHFNPKTPDMGDYFRYNAYEAFLSGAREKIYNQAPAKALTIAKNDRFTLYCAALYKLAEYEIKSFPPDKLSSGAYFLALPADLPGMTQADMSALRAWLRERLSGIEMGSLDDLVCDGGRYGEQGIDDLSRYGGSLLSLDSYAFRDMSMIPAPGIITRIDSTHYVLCASIFHANLSAEGFQLGFAKQPDGSWKLELFGFTWIS